jgi:hypothetical protein
MDVPGYTKTFSMDQGQILGNDQIFQALFNAPLSDGKRQGICCGLSIVWCARRMMFHDESAQERCTGLVSMGGFRFGGRSQDIMMAAPTAGTTTEEVYRSWFDPALKTYVLRMVQGSVVRNPRPISISKMVEAVKPSGTYSLYNIGLETTTGSAAHMVASYASHGTMGMNRHFYFFDPNMGEYRIGTGDTGDFLLKVAEAYDSSFVSLTGFDLFEIERG